MNAIFRRMASLGGSEPKKRKINYPVTTAWKRSGEEIEFVGYGDLTIFPEADFVNVLHRNGKTTVIKSSNL